MPETLSSLSAIAHRELQLAVRQKGNYFQALMFFVLIAMTFPLALGPSAATLTPLAPAIIAVAALLASLLSLDLLFRRDWLDGTLEQMVLLGEPLYLIVLIKVFAHWLLSGLPLLLMSLVLALTLYLPTQALPALLLTLLLATPVLSFIGAIGAALAVRVRHSGLLIALLVVPLYVPVLILAVQAVEHAALGLGATGLLLWLAALLFFTLTLAPLAIAGALKVLLYSP